MSLHFMYKPFIIIIFFILIGCNSPHYKEIIVNKSVVVRSEKYHNVQMDNYILKWSPPIGPDDKKNECALKNEMLIFTPNKVGNYEVHLSIEDSSEKIISKEIFYFNARLETTNVSIVDIKKEVLIDGQSINKPNPENKILKKPDSKPSNALKKQKKNKRNNVHKKSNSNHTISIKYAIQIASWPSLDEARTHKLELLQEGFDAYIERYYSKKKNEVWYRVRLGNFSNKNQAMKLKKKIESSKNITTWLDIVSTK